MVPLYCRYSNYPVFFQVFQLKKDNEELQTKLSAATEDSEKGQSALVSYREQVTKENLDS